MHGARSVEAARALAARGATATEVARRLRIPRSTVRDWLAGAIPHSAGPGVCGDCHAEHRFDELTADYVYLFGLYLGDGYICRAPRDVFKLRIVLDIKYPVLVETAAVAMSSVRGKATGRQLRPCNCIELYSYWRCWPCLFPQHGPGKKHERPIVLSRWQGELVDRWPAELIRGLIHSDGCRFQNTGTNWSWPRYAFTNHSADIRSIFCLACDRLGLRWTEAGERKIYVSRKADVAILDGFIGPKQ